MSKIIYLDVDEEITSVIDRIKKVKEEQEITLFFPKRASLVQSIVNLKLLKRQADILNKKIIIVTSDETGFNLAKKSGFKVEKELRKNKAVKENKELIDNKEDKIKIEKFLKVKEDKKKDNKNYNNIFSKKIINASENNDESFELKEESDRKKKRTPRKSKNKKIVLLPSIGFKSLAIFFLISFILISIMFFVVLPKADIIITPKTEPFASSLEISISDNVDRVDEENRIMTGNLEEIELKSDQKEFEATGEKDVGEKAQGKVILYNNFSSTPQVLVASTRVQSQGKTYFIMSEVTIPGARIEGGEQIPGEKEVIVEAEGTGEEYNIDPSNFVIPGLTPSRQKSIYGKSQVPFSGGSSKKVKVITEDDLKNANGSLLTNIHQKGIEEINDSIGKEWMVIESTSQDEILSLKTDGENEKEANSFKMEIKAKVMVMSFKKEDIENLIFGVLSNDISGDKFFVNQSVDQGVDFEKKNFDIEHAILDLNVRVSKEIGLKVDEMMVKRLIKGKTKEETIKYITDNSIGEAVKVELWPFWVKKVPQIEKKIKIILDTT